MNNLQKRNKKIIRLLNLNFSYKRVAKLYQLSEGSVRQIYKLHTIEKKRKKIRKQLFREIRKSNDTDKKWPMPDFVDSLKLSLRARKLLKKFYKSHNQTEISLNELMDSLSPQPESEKVEYHTIPLIHQKQLWKKTYWEIVECLTRTRLCDKFSNEWKKRKVIINKLLDG